MKLKYWILAARPKTLTGALIPVLVGTSLALRDGVFQLFPFLCCLLFACGMQIAANFINDYYDFQKGSDREDRLGPERACAQGWITPKAMLRGIIVTLLLSALCGCGLLLRWQSFPYNGLELIVVGACCILFAFLYTTYLSYLGFGDALVFICFGLIPVCGTYYVQGYQLTTDVFIASIACGLEIDSLLLVNNYRDREQDALSNKYTLIVRFGEPFGRYAYLIIGLCAALLMLTFNPDHKLYIYLAAFFYAYTHFRTWKKMCTIHSGKALNSILGETSRNMMLYGLLLAAIILNA